MGKTIILRIQSADKKGLVASVTGFIFKHKGNIIRLDQYTNSVDNKFFMRVEWEAKGFALSKDQLQKELPKLARTLGISVQVFYSDELPQVALFVSKYDHCLFDLLLRVRSGELAMEIPLIISNHPDLEDVANMFSIPFYYFPSGKHNATQEKNILKELRSANVDLVVLARYMQVLSKGFVEQYPWKVINVHHSFLPAFSGAKPYHQAYARGVKVIGATSHFVTEKLDAGPIIEQETIKISHEDSVEDLVMKGRDLERKVLAQAVQLFIQHRLFVDGQRTIIL